MFVTNVTPNAPIAGAIDDTGFRDWPYVTLATDVPVYMVEYRYLITIDFTIPRSTFLSDIEQLIELDNDPKVTIIKTYLLSPDSLNNRHQWLLEPITEIKEARIRNTDKKAVIFSLENGNKYIDAIVDIDPESLNHTKLIFSN